MPSQNTKRHILIILFIQPVIWSFSNSLPAKGDKLAPWDWDDFTWYPRYTTPKPYIRYRYTLSPDDRPSTQSGFPTVFLVIYIFVGVVITVSLVVMLIKCACAMKSDCSSAYDSNPTMHRPPERIMQHPPPQNVSNWGTPIRGDLFDYPPNTNLGGGMPNYPANINLGSGVPNYPENPNFRGGVPNYLAPINAMSSSAYRAVDKPPDYPEVVSSDFVDENKEFKELFPKPLDTSPPTYEDDSLRRY